MHDGVFALLLHYFRFELLFENRSLVCFRDTLTGNADRLSLELSDSLSMTKCVCVTNRCFPDILLIGKSLPPVTKTEQLELL
jgi:hypothetical protein